MHFARASKDSSWVKCSVVYDFPYLSFTRCATSGNSIITGLNTVGDHIDRFSLLGTRDECRDIRTERVVDAVNVCPSEYAKQLFQTSIEGDPRNFVIRPFVGAQQS